MLEVSKHLQGLPVHLAGGLGHLSDWCDGGNVTRHGTDLLARQAQEFRMVEKAREGGAGLVARELLRSHQDLENIYSTLGHGDIDCF